MTHDVWTPSHRQASRSRQRGAVLLEGLALLPILVLVMAGTLFFFRIFRETGRATDLARQKAWLAASSGCTQEAVELSSQGTMLQELSSTPSPSGTPGPSGTAIPPVPAGFDEVSGAAPASIDSRKATAVVPIHASTGTGPSSAFEYKGEARLTLLCNEVPKAGDLVSAAVDTFGRLTQW